jgi:putative nucleotidyltransferase with HDIG domain
MGGDRISIEVLHFDQSLLEFVEALAQALDARDPYTAGHSIRVAEYSFQIAQQIGLNRDMAELVYVGAHLHDIGKIGMPDAVLQKPGKLTAVEFAIVQQHPVIGRRILSHVAGLEKYLNVVELHHENVDGSGYPHGLQGEEIPLDARIVRVADAFDAMTSSRAYRARRSVETALEEIRICAGRQFDEACAEAILSLAQAGMLHRPQRMPDPDFVDLASLHQAIAETGYVCPGSSRS